MRGNLEAASVQLWTEPEQTEPDGKAAKSRIGNSMLFFSEILGNDIGFSEGMHLSRASNASLPFLGHFPVASVFGFAGCLLSTLPANVLA